MRAVETSTHLDRRRELKGSPTTWYERMVEIRVCEDRILELFSEGKVRGSTHTAQGQEAVAIGVAEVAEPSDIVTCTYRGHAMALALGLTPLSVLAEILGREAGCTRGIGGSMHLGDLNVGLMPTFAIVGAGIPVAAGAALTASVKGTSDIAIGVFGDGAANIGAFHEGLNLAAIWDLPVVFVCENNLYGEYSRIDRTTPLEDLAERGASYGMPSSVVDGQDVDTVVAVLTEACDRARSGGGPTFLEMKTYRYAGHSRTDQATYRPEGELEEWLARDPIEILGQRLVDRGELTADDRERILEETENAIEEALQRALDSPQPAVSELLAHVTANGDA